MKKFTEFVKKHKKGLIILAVILVIVIVIAVLVHRTKKKAEDMLAGMAQETFVLEKRNLVKSVSSTGKISSAEKKDIIVAELANTKIASINVSLGDMVNAGDILCTLDTEDIERNLENARTDLAISQKKTANSMENEGRNLYNTQLDAVLDTNRNLEALDKAQRIYDTEQGEKAEASRIYDEVEDVYEEYWDEDEYYDLKEELAQVNRELEPYIGNEPSKDDTTSDYYKNYKYLIDRAAYLSNRINNLETAKSNLSTAKNSTDSASRNLDSAEDNLTDAKRKQEDNYRKDVSGVKNAENNYENAKLDSTVASRTYEDNVRKFEKQLENATVRAPFKGLVTAINFDPGDTYNGQTLIMLEDMSTYIIEASVDEYDISLVKVGQNVKFKTNATGDEELEAVVTEIAPRATVAAAANGSAAAAASSVASYAVKMKILSDCSNLRLDMTAKVNIIVDSADNVYAVPFAAVQTDDAGEKYIEIEDDSATEASAPTFDKEDMKDPAKQQEAIQAAMNAAAGNAPTKRIPVTVGVETDYYVEIESPELYDGMSVIVPSSGGGMDELMSMMGAMGGM